MTDKLVSVQRQVSTRDAAGQVNDDWNEITQWWAAIKPISGREYFNASGERAEVTHEIGMRYGVDVRPRDRVVYGSRVFNVRSVLNIEERNRHLKLMCSEHVV